MRPLRVTVLGGGNGAAAVLRGFARSVRTGRSIELRAVIATADDGGSSGRIRRERGGLPVGDFRNALLAMAPENGDRIVRLFAHRYAGSGELAGHALGNLLLAALAEQEGCYRKGLDLAAGMLAACGHVIPATDEPVSLRAETAGGRVLDGETVIGTADETIRRVWLEPADPGSPAEAVEAIRRCDLLVLGPGSLYTSLLSVLSVPALAEAFRASRGHRVLVSNLMTQPGETSRMRLNAHLEALDRHLGTRVIQTVLAHGAPFEPWRLAPYSAEGSEPVLEPLLEGRSERVVTADIVSRSGKIRHDPDRTAAALLALAESRARRAPQGSGASTSGRAIREVTSR